jgi:hypothetical protein
VALSSRDLKSFSRETAKYRKLRLDRKRRAARETPRPWPRVAEAPVDTRAARARSAKIREDDCRWLKSVIPMPNVSS